MTNQKARGDKQVHRHVVPGAAFDAVAEPPVRHNQPKRQLPLGVSWIFLVDQLNSSSQIGWQQVVSEGIPTSSQLVTLDAPSTPFQTQ